MKEKDIELIPIVVVILVVVGFVMALALNPETTINNLAKDADGEVAGALVLNQSYIADANSFSGEVMAPSACHHLVTGVEINNTSPEQIKLKLTTESDDSDTDNCGVESVEKDFEIVIPSSPQAQLVAVELNGQPVQFRVNQN